MKRRLSRVARGSEHKAVRNLSSSLRPLGLEPVRPLRLTRKTRSGLHKTPGGVFRRAAYGLPGFDFRPGGIASHPQIAWVDSVACVAWTAMFRLTPLTPALYPFFLNWGGDSVPAKPTWRLIGQRGAAGMAIDEQNPRADEVCTCTAQVNRVGNLPSWRQRLRTHVVSRGIQMMCGSTVDVSAMRRQIFLWSGPRYDCPG